MSYSALIKIGRLVTADLVNSEPRADISLYQRGALKLNGGAPPVLVDHDYDRPIGQVLGLFEAPDTDGHWLWARCRIDQPPDWLKKGTKASIGYKALFRGGMGEWSWIHRGLLTEVSILSPGVQPAEPLAHVALLERAASPAAGTDRPVVGDTVIYHPPGVLRRPGIGRVIGVR